jgi:hypothetical protein
MAKIRIIIAILIIGAISLTTYIYFRKQPVESVPEKATLVLNQKIIIEEEVVAL